MVAIVARVLFLTDEFLIDCLGIGYLSSALKCAGHETALVQLPIALGDYQIGRAVELARRWHPHLLAYSVTTGQHKLWRDANINIRAALHSDRCYPLSVFGGPHCTFFPDFIKERNVDVICRGEGERAIVALADAAVKSERRGDYSFEVEIPNLWLFQGSVKNDIAPLADINSFAWPDRELLYSHERNARNPIRNVMASRGCPYNCPYCYNEAYRQIHKGKGETRRVRAPEDVVNEIEALVRDYPTRMIYFQDDILVIPRPWFYELTDRYAARIGLPYHCHVRANLLVESDVAQLKRTGCHGVTLAIEAGNELLRRLALNRRMSDGEIVQACAWIREADLRLRTENMIGIPGETVASAWETIHLNRRCKPDVPWASLYQPYPGTKLGELAEEMGLCKVAPDDVKPSFFEDLVLRLKDRRKLIGMQRWFALAVRSRIIRCLLPLLIRLPRNHWSLRLSDWYRRRLYRTRLYKLENECKGR